MLKRLRDWWTRPTWEEYLAETRAYVDAHAANDNLVVDLYEARQEAKGLAEVVKKLGGDLDDCLKANNDLNEDAASRLADAQIALDRKVTEKMDEVRSHRETDMKLLVAKNEIRRLEGLLMDQVENTQILPTMNPDKKD